MGKVLVATADAAYYEILAAEIEAEGHGLLWAGNGKDALEMTIAAQPDLVLVDNALPIFSGIETVAALREDPEVPQDLPILLASHEELDPHALDRAGVTRPVPKNHGIQAFREILVDCLQGYRNR